MVVKEKGASAGRRGGGACGGCVWRVRGPGCGRLNQSNLKVPCNRREPGNNITEVKRFCILANIIHRL